MVLGTFSRNDAILGILAPIVPIACSRRGSHICGGLLKLFHLHPISPLGGARGASRRANFAWGDGRLGYRMIN